MKLTFLPLLLISFGSIGELPAAEISGTSIIPHTIESSMRYRRPRDPNLAALVQLFIKGPARPTRFNGLTPAELLATNRWAWHDLGALEIGTTAGPLWAHLHVNASPARTSKKVAVRRHLPTSRERADWGGAKAEMRSPVSATIATRHSSSYSLRAQ